MTLGVEKLAGLAAGDTVRARYETGGSIVELCSVVDRNEVSGWFRQNMIGGWVGLKQIDTPVVNDLLVEVVSVTKPPYAQGATEPEPQVGDVVVSGMVRGEGWRSDGEHRWMFIGQGQWIDNGRRVTEKLNLYKRADLPERLRLVRRLQDWPVIDRKWDSDEEFAEQFAVAQRMMAAKIRALHNYGGSYDRDTVLDEAAKVVECFDLDDAYPGED